MRTYLVEMIWSFLRVLHGVDAIKERFVQLREPRGALSVVGIEVFFDDARCSCCLWVQWPTLPPTKHISCMGPWCHQWCYLRVSSVIPGRTCEGKEKKPTLAMK